MKSQRRYCNTGIGWALAGESHRESASLHGHGEIGLSMTKDVLAGSSAPPPPPPPRPGLTPVDGDVRTVAISTASIPGAAKQRRGRRVDRERVVLPLLGHARCCALRWIAHIAIMQALTCVRLTASATNVASAWTRAIRRAEMPTAHRIISAIPLITGRRSAAAPARFVAASTISEGARPSRRLCRRPVLADHVAELASRSR